MAISFVQAVSMSFIGSSPYTNTFSSSTTTGNLIVCFFNGLAGATPTIAMDGGESFTVLYDDTTTMSGYHNTVWYATSKGGKVVTVTENTVGGLAGFCSGEWSGIDTLDQHAVGAGTTTPTFTTTQANELMLAFWASNTPFGGGGGGFVFECGVQFSGSYYAIMCDNIVSSIQTSINATPSGGSGGSAGIGTFYKAAVVSANHNRLMLMGVGT